MRLNQIYAKYKNDVHFYVIYIREAHPDDGWRVPDNLKARIHYKEPRTDDERTQVASVCQSQLDLQMPMLVDSIGNDVEEKYISLPMRLYLVGADCTIAYSGDRGPFGFNPDTWEEAIQKSVPFGSEPGRGESEAGDIRES
ncbi:MAG: hypothetical protein EXR27_18790 [Betaproteobacteria bacterium]|nr:hypothetical protein [Betaproteobacteria bacterium]